MGTDRKIDFQCPKCTEVLKGELKDAGGETVCPACGAPVQVPSRSSNSPPPPLPPLTRVSRPVVLPSIAEERRQAHRLLVAGWICFGVGMLFLPVLLIFHVSVPLFIGAIVLSIIAMTKGRAGAGLALLLCSVLGCSGDCWHADPRTSCP